MILIFGNNDNDNNNNHINITIVNNDTPVSVRRFPSFRTQPLENLTPLPTNKWAPEQPSPWRKSSKRESCYGDRVNIIYIYFDTVYLIHIHQLLT